VELPTIKFYVNSLSGFTVVTFEETDMAKLTDIFMKLLVANLQRPRQFMSLTRYRIQRDALTSLVFKYYICYLH
jgi:hypothetical protein